MYPTCTPGIPHVPLVITHVPHVSHMYPMYPTCTPCIPHVPLVITPFVLYLVACFMQKEMLYVTHGATLVHAAKCLVCDQLKREHSGKSISELEQFFAF